MKKLLATHLLIATAFFCNSQNWMDVNGGVTKIGSSFGTVYALVNDTITNRLWVAGDFDHAGNVKAKNLAFWDGSEWHYVIDSNNNYVVCNAACLYDSLVAIGTTLGAVSLFTDSSYTVIGLANNDINVLYSYNDRLYAGGEFTNIDGVTAHGIAYYDSMGWHGMPPGPGVDGLSAQVRDIRVYNGDVIAAGFFQVAGFSQAYNIARWDGNDWYPLGSGTSEAGVPFGGSVYALEVYNGELYAGGAFDSAGGILCNEIARWDGTQWNTADGGLYPDVYTLKIHDSSLYAGGLFFGPPYKIGKWDGTLWYDLGFGASGYIKAIAFFDNVLFVAGAFLEAGTTPVQSIAYYDLETGNSASMLFTADELNLFPNPAADKAYLSGSLHNAKVSVINSLGQLVLQTVYNPGQPIDASALPAGFYSLLLTSQKKREAVSFIKQ